MDLVIDRGAEMDVPEEFYETDRTKLRRALPWLHLFRAFRIALDPRKLALGGVAFVLLAAGEWGFSRLPFAPRPDAHARDARGGWPWEEPVIAGATRPPSLAGMVRAPWRTVQEAAAHGSVLLAPLRSVVRPGMLLFRRGNTWGDAASAWTELLWAIVVWGVFGGAIARLAAVQFAQRGDAGLRGSLQYVGGRFLSYVAAPLLPLVFIGLFWLMCAVLGLAGRVPGVGPVIAGALWFVPLLLGLAMTVLVLFIAAGWPLMYAAVSTDGGDGFDGLARSYDYLMTRPWYALGLGLLALAYGSVLVFFVYAVAGIGVHLGHWAIASGMGEPRAAAITADAPEPLVSGERRDVAAAESGAGAALTAFWLRVAAVLLWGFVGSYFWTALTIIYVLLRKSVDAAPLEQVFLERDSGERPTVVGMAAAEARETAAGTAHGESQPTKE